MWVSLPLFLGILISLSTLNAIPEAFFRCYSGTLKNYKTTPIHKPLGILSCIDKTKNTTIYTHGHIDRAETPETTKMLLLSLLLLDNVNVVYLDYEHAVPWTNTASYATTVAAVKKMASVVAEALVTLNEHGVRLDTMQLIGHGIGAHAMGWVGEEVQHRINKNISCIVGLEPAGTRFGNLIGLEGLNPSQARFVIGVHTSKGPYDTSLSVGAVDFWANCADCDNDQRQPGCSDDICDYNRVVYIYAEAILDPKAFPTVFAHSCRDWRTQKTSSLPINYLGDNSDPRESGRSLSFFFSTNSRAPYSKGHAGIIPN